MYGNLLVLLSAAWLGPMLSSAPVTPARNQAWLAAIALGLAGVAAAASLRSALVGYLVAFAFASSLLWLGASLARLTRRAAVRMLAVAVGGGLLAVAVQAVVLDRPPGSSLLGMGPTALLLGLLAPAAAAMSARLREADAPQALQGLPLHACAALALALGLSALLPALPT